MYSEDQKQFTGRAMIALSASHAELIKAVAKLAAFDPTEAAAIAESAARNMEQAAGYIRLSVAAQGGEATIPARLVTAAHLTKAM